MSESSWGYLAGLALALVAGTFFFISSPTSNRETIRETIREVPVQVPLSTHIEYLAPHVIPDDLEKELNRLGADGWILTGYVWDPGTGRYRLMLMRAKKEPK